MATDSVRSHHAPPTRPIIPTLSGMTSLKPPRSLRFALPRPKNALLFTLLPLAVARAEPPPETVHLVENGKSVHAVVTGGAWRQGDGHLEQAGTGKFLLSELAIGEGDFTIEAKIVLMSIDGTAASLTLGDSHFGFDGRGEKLFLEGPIFGGGVRALGSTAEHITPGESFIVEVSRSDGVICLTIDEHEVATQEFLGSVGQVGLRPWRNTLRVYHFRISGELVDPATIDLDAQMQGTNLTTQSNVYRSGRDGYHTYRIPSVIVAPNGDLLAFCEGRRAHGGDSGDIDLVMKRSLDGGHTWSKQAVVWDDGANTCGNPCPVVDEATGTIWLLTTHNLGGDREAQIIRQESKGTRTVWVTSSEDSGVSWTEPREITKTTKLPDWTWYATGPGAGIQLRRGEHVGRLVIPCDHIEAGTGHYYSHVIYSDDHGETWALGGSTPQHQVNECEVVELADGELMLNMRNYDRSQRTRQVAASTDGGATWTGQRHDETLIEPICQASIRRARWPKDEEPGLILFSNPASREGRVKMTVRASVDEGRTWPHARVLHTGGSAYSCLVALPDGDLGCLYEADGYRRIVFARFDLEWILGEGD